MKGQLLSHQLDLVNQTILYQSIEKLIQENEQINASLEHPLPSESQINLLNLQLIYTEHKILSLSKIHDTLISDRIKIQKESISSLKKIQKEIKSAQIQNNFYVLDMATNVHNMQKRCEEAESDLLRINKEISKKAELLKQLRDDNFNLSTSLSSHSTILEDEAKKVEEQFSQSAIDLQKQLNILSLKQNTSLHDQTTENNHDEEEEISARSDEE